MLDILLSKEINIQPISFEMLAVTVWHKQAIKWTLIITLGFNHWIELILPMQTYLFFYKNTK